MTKKDSQVYSPKRTAEFADTVFDELIDSGASRIPDKTKPAFKLIIEMFMLAVSDCREFGEGKPATIDRIDATDWLFYSSHGQPLDLAVEFLELATGIPLSTAMVRESLLRQQVFNDALKRLNFMYEQKAA